MDSSDKSVSIVTFFLCMMVVAAILMISSCVVREKEIGLPLEKVRLEGEYRLQVECLKNKGKWVPRDNDNRPPYVCKFEG